MFWKSQWYLVQENRFYLCHIKIAANDIWFKIWTRTYIRYVMSKNPIIHALHAHTEGYLVLGGGGHSLLYDNLKRTSSHKPTSVWSVFQCIFFIPLLTVLLLYIPSLLSRTHGQGCPQVFKRWYCHVMVSEYCGLSRPFFKEGKIVPFLCQTQFQEKLGSTSKWFFKKAIHILKAICQLLIR